MASKSLDRRAKTAVIAAGCLIVAAPILAIGRYASTQMESTTIAEGHAHDDRLVSLNGKTMLLPPGTVARKIADWLKLGARGNHGFQIGDESFVAGKSDFKPEASERLEMLAQVLKHHREITTDIVVATAADPQPTLVKLEESRAARLKSALIGHGVPPIRVEVEEEEIATLLAQHRIERESGVSRIYVILSRSHA